MKKNIVIMMLIFIMIIALQMPVLAVTDESTEVLRNPDRGFYKFT